MNVCALIPSYNPDIQLISTAVDLRAVGFHHIIVVDDGSRPDCQPYFQELIHMDCKVVRLPQNSGKGEALKLGFLTFLTQGWSDAGSKMSLSSRWAGKYWVAGQNVSLHSVH